MVDMKNNWDQIIKSKNGWFDFNLKEIFAYRDLIYMLVKRDFVTFYKQTILGPLWYIIQPLVNTIVFTVIFGKLAQIPTEGVPNFIFYLAGTVVWGYFAICITTTSNTFVTNAGIFSKVYFPRLAIPIANVIISLLQFLIQFVIFIIFLLYFIFQESNIEPNLFVFILPLLLLQMAILGLGVGMMISALTAKYRDLTFAMTFGVQLLMFASPVVYPFSIIPDNYKFLASLNPMTSIIEMFRYAFLGVSSIESQYIFNSVIVTIILFFIGITLFSKVEKNFMDTV
tara:strand:+ start:695 stop:1546 length:852 start_codon:yes stop_codon:yes gene_type:complete